ncbi:MAG: leucyl/phenylalanyl-tRNA--protein transferase [Gallionella sp.]
MISWLAKDTPFPPVETALVSPNGLLAAGGDLTAPKLLEAYRQGIFPWFNPGEPILWWSPDPRMVLVPGEFRISRSLARTLRDTGHDVRCDTVFEQVMRCCAAPRAAQSGTWIGEDMIAAYCELHQSGYAHSVETWMDGRLVGGLYGVGIGRMFYGESMFSLASNASKIALAHLAAQLERWQFGLIDCQMYTPHLASLGAREIPRGEFIASVKELIHCTPVNEKSSTGHQTGWQFDSDLFG